MLDRIEAAIQLEDSSWLALHRPVDIVQARSPGAVVAALASVERLTRERNCHAVGYVSYEAGAAFGLDVFEGPTDLPAVWFALFERQNVHEIEHPRATASYELGSLSPSMGFDAFARAFDQIKRYLAEGDSYQVNYTFRLEGSFTGDPGGLWGDLVAAQGGRYSAFIRTPTHSICSASPELFFSRNGTALAARPMKGTARRGRTLDEDRRQAEQLRSSAKERAENIMVVDMVRNDLGRIAEVGSIAVPDLLAVERYPNVWQMTSLVTARSSASLADIFSAMHPSASITGAPKKRTMEILRTLEGRPRGVYTGAIGHVGPDGAARFNVAIRTAVVNHLDGRVTFGVGSGIVWDSEPAAEYAECLLKGTILGRGLAEFELLETLQWTPVDRYFLLDRHLDRMRESAEYFGFPFPSGEIREAIDRAVDRCDVAMRVRLLLSRAGRVRVEHTPLQRAGAPRRIALAEAPIDRGDVFLFHKTTNRTVYDRARADGQDDVVLWNTQGEVTEASTANVVVEREGGRRVTPPVACGLLAGTFRAELLARGEISEAIVTVDELRSASRIWLINSVHGWREAVMS